MSSSHSDAPSTATQASVLHDRRPTPRGVLPRQMQMWLMVGLAVVILLIILVTGHSQPAPRASAGAPTAAPALATADRIRSYQKQLADDERRQQQMDRQQSALDQRATTTQAAPAGSSAVDPVADDRRRREYQSLFSDNVAFTHRARAVIDRTALAVPTTVQTEPPPFPANTPGQSSSPPRVVISDTGTTKPSGPNSTEPPRDENPAPGPRLRVLEGTVIETALVNRLEGTFAGPVLCLVTTPVYSHDRQHIVIPAGARALGAAAPVQAWGESRLAITFHRLVMPDGHTYTLDRFKGLDQIGITGLRDEVNRHYFQVFGASLAIGAISGLAQFNTRSGLDYTFSDASRQAAGASLATSTSRVLDRYLNVLPTITIREGFRIKVYLTNDLDLPAYEPGQGGGE